jgi:hypothetical protein
MITLPYYVLHWLVLDHLTILWCGACRLSLFPRVTGAYRIISSVAWTALIRACIMPIEKIVHGTEHYRESPDI